MNDYPNHIFCKIHGKKIKFIYIGLEQTFPRIVCKKCVEIIKREEIQQNFIKLKQAFKGFTVDTGNLNLQIFSRQEQFSQINKQGNIIIDLLKSEQLCLENMLSEINLLSQSVISNIQKLNQNVQNFNYKDVEMYAELYFKRNHLNIDQEEQFQQNINQIANKFLDQFQKTNNQIKEILTNLTSKIFSFKSDLNEEDLLQQSRIKCSSAKINLFEYLECSQTIVTTIDNQIKILCRDSQEFKIKQEITCQHKIGALSLNPKNKKIYITTEDKAIFIYQFINKVYEQESQIPINDDIKKIIFDPTDRNFIACSDTQILVFDNVTMQLKQNLKDTRLVHSIMNCYDINNSGSYLICFTQTQFQLWEQQFSCWKLSKLFSIQNQKSVCFINNQQFFSLDSEGHITFWHIQFNQIKHTQILQALPGTLKFCSNLKILICFNSSIYQFYQLKDNGEIILLKERKGENLNLCLSGNGEELVVLANGQINLQQNIFDILVKQKN